MDDAAFHRFLERSVSVVLGGSTGENEAWGNEPIRLTRLAGDGSTREIFRIEGADVRLVAVSNRLPAGRDHPDENESWLAVREYLDRRTVPVPRVYAADTDHGFFLIEDLGDVRLADRLGSDAWSDPKRGQAFEALYAIAIDHLVRMQALADPPFRMSMVGNEPYTEEFILAREAGYFFEEFILGYKKTDLSFSRIEEDCRRLAADAGAVPGQSGGPAVREPVFMHRDYQSRNLMIVGPTLVVIDFQGARFGPPEYDVAALLYDPYARIPVSIRERLLALYVEAASRRNIPGIPKNLKSPGAEAWRRRFLANAANRLMQALGAFTKLGSRLERPGFLEHVGPGLSLLDSVLEERADCPGLHATVRRLRRS